VSAAGLKITMDSRSVSRTRAGLQAVRKYATGGAWNMLNRLTLKFIRSAVAGTPISGKKREIFTAKGPAEMRALGGWRYAIKFPFGLTHHAERTGGTIDGQAWVGTNSKTIADEIADVYYRGAAKASWGGMFRKMGAAWTPASGRLARVMSTSNWIRFNRTAPKQSIVTINRFTIMDKVAPGIQEKALAKAKNSLEHQEKAAMRAGLGVAWRSAA